eukprot:c21628_g1_i1 orf=534-3200(+)
MQGFPQSSALNSSSLSSPISSSIAGDPPVDSRLNQKLAQRDDTECVLANGDHTHTDLAGGTLTEGLEKITHRPTSLNIPSCEVQDDRKDTIPSNGGVEVSDLAQNHQINTVQDMGAVGSGDPLYRKHATSDVSLRRVLSDTISGVLMEDAMVTPCGHSFGNSGLRRVMETNLCLTCGAPVPADSLIPNYALRAAVLAYEREGTRMKKDLSVQAENDRRRYNRALADSDVSRPRGVQFPYVANDRVLIKGNKRTPERFVGREAIITTQCLNGWYLVKTLDNGESVRLQYRSLQKVGDKETTTELQARTGNGKVIERTCNFEGYKGPLISPFDCKEGSPSTFNDKIGTSSFPSGVAKGTRSEFLSRSKRANHGRRRGNQMRVTDASGASWQSGHTSSNSSQELQGEQVKKVLDLHNLQLHGKCAQEAVTMYDSAEEDKRATKRIAAIGTTGGMIEGLALHSNCSVRERKAMNSRVWGDADGCVAELKSFKKAEAVNAGEHVVGRGPHGARSQGKHSRARPKHNSAQTHNFLSTRSDLQEADPYKKVYVSGIRRRGSGGDGQALMASKQSAFASLNMDTDLCSALPFEEHHQEAEIKTSGESSSLQSAASFCEMLKKGMLDLEAEIPWSYMRNEWKTNQADWLQRLQKSSTMKDIGKRLEELRRALILEKAGNMSDDEWSERLEAAVGLEAVDAVDHLWERLREDVSKLIDSKLKRDSKPMSNIKVEFLELKSQFPHLCIGGLSHVGVIAATSMAAAEAYAVGEQDIETLLAIPMKLVQEHSKQDLCVVIDAIEREKRHLLAKVSNLGSGTYNNGHSKNEDVDNLLIENPKQVPMSPTFLRAESAPFASEFSNEPRHMDYEEAPLMDADSEEEVVPMEETDGEETELSDSD